MDTYEYSSTLKNGGRRGRGVNERDLGETQPRAVLGTRHCEHHALAAPFVAMYSKQFHLRVYQCQDTWLVGPVVTVSFGECVIFLSFSAQPLALQALRYTSVGWSNLFQQP